VKTKKERHTSLLLVQKKKAMFGDEKSVDEVNDRGSRTTSHKNEIHYFLLCFFLHLPVFSTSGNKIKKVKLPFNLQNASIFFIKYGFSEKHLVGSKIFSLRRRTPSGVWVPKKKTKNCVDW